MEWYYNCILMFESCCIPSHHGFAGSYNLEFQNQHVLNHHPPAMVPNSGLHNYNDISFSMHICYMWFILHLKSIFVSFLANRVWLLWHINISTEYVLVHLLCNQNVWLQVKSWSNFMHLFLVFKFQYFPFDKGFVSSKTRAAR